MLAINMAVEWAKFPPDSAWKAWKAPLYSLQDKALEVDLTFNFKWKT